MNINGGWDRLRSDANNSFYFRFSCLRGGFLHEQEVGNTKANKLYFLDGDKQQAVPAEDRGLNQYRTSIYKVISWIVFIEESEFSKNRIERRMTEDSDNESYGDCMIKTIQRSDILTFQGSTDTKNKTKQVWRKLHSYILLWRL